MWHAPEPRREERLLVVAPGPLTRPAARIRVDRCPNGLGRAPDPLVGFDGSGTAALRAGGLLDGHGPQDTTVWGLLSGRGERK
jgi:hypothetical protein